jgi:hypothetical protein
MGMRNPFGGAVSQFELSHARDLLDAMLDSTDDPAVVLSAIEAITSDPLVVSTAKAMIEEAARRREQGELD